MDEIAKSACTGENLRSVHEAVGRQPIEINLRSLVFLCKIGLYRSGSPVSHFNYVFLKTNKELLRLFFALHTESTSQYIDSIPIGRKTGFFEETLKKSKSGNGLKIIKQISFDVPCYCDSEQHNKNVVKLKREMEEKNVFLRDLSDFLTILTASLLSIQLCVQNLKTPLASPLSL